MVAVSFTERVSKSDGDEQTGRRDSAEDRDQDGRLVARRVARWHIGDPDWADLIINAYLNPKTHQEQLEQEMKDDD